MPFIPVPNTAQVEIRYDLDGQQIENTLYFEYGDSPTLASYTSLINAVESWVTDEVIPLVPPQLVLREIVATDLTSATGLQLALGPVGGTPGTLGQPAMPNNVSLAVSFRTALRGRSFRGRNYWPCLTEGQVVGNEVAGATVTAIAGAYQAVLAIGDDTVPNCTWVVVSRYSGVDSDGKPIPRVTGVTTPVTSVVVVDAVVDSMRRRLPGRGR